MPFFQNAFPKQTGYTPRLSQSGASGDQSGGSDMAKQAQEAAQNAAGQNQKPESPTSPNRRRV